MTAHPLKLVVNPNMCRVHDIFKRASAHHHIICNRHENVWITIVKNIHLPLNLMKSFQSDLIQNNVSDICLIDELFQLRVTTFPAINNHVHECILSALAKVELDLVQGVFEATTASKFLSQDVILNYVLHQLVLVDLLFVIFQ